MLGRMKDTVVETSKSVCIPDTQACMRVCRLGPGGHTLVRGKPVCARYKLAYTLGKLACKMVRRSTVFDLDILACIRACIPVYTPACIPACTRVCIPDRENNSADNKVLGQQQQQQLKLRRIRPGKIVCHFIEFFLKIRIIIPS
jgi:hypothetical protein